MKAKLANIKVVYVEIELPDVCPNCNADFNKAAVRTWEFQDQERYGKRFPNGRFQEVDRDCVPEPGETFIEGLAYYCGGCGYCMASYNYDEDRSALADTEGEVPLEPSPKDPEATASHTSLDDASGVLPEGG